MKNYLIQPKPDSLNFNSRASVISPNDPKFDTRLSQWDTWPWQAEYFKPPSSQISKPAWSATDELMIENPGKSFSHCKCCGDFLAAHKALLIGLAIGVLLAAVGLATVTSMWLITNCTTTTTISNRDTTTPTTGTTTTTITTTTETTTTTTVTTSTITTTTVTTATQLCTTQSYSSSFTSAVAPTSAQCTAWGTFRTSLTCSSYTLLQFYGLVSSSGLNVTDPTIVNGIAAALLNYTNYGPITSNGYSWAVDVCAGSVELTVGGTCTCSATYAIRACITNGNWGGVSGTSTCSQASQTITVKFS
ncbi:unnamed protein product [Rotaria sordida]|uniref:Uncharacterized protein n=1 Tax=Rotaria sordida TaxID=392033 RepID=A0A818TPQ7_9BILA|nr:unnamed protein product [Rotaria sordida]CAF3686151.1 unnamed protein product [Rotaria sordida]